VVARREADAAALERELDALCLEHIARFKRPKAYVFLAELPKNNTGKVLKTVLRERVANDKSAFQHTR
jgi:long-chain acyl-CoA synthetase